MAFRLPADVDERPVAVDGAGTLGRPVSVSLGGPPPKGNVMAYLLGMAAGDLTGGPRSRPPRPWRAAS